MSESPTEFLPPVEEDEPMTPLEALAELSEAAARRHRGE